MTGTSIVEETERELHDLADRLTTPRTEDHGVTEVEDGSTRGCVLWVRSRRGR
jgi:hypothetical protein